MSEPVKLASFVFPELGKQRLDAQWARIAERRPLAPRRTTRAIPIAGALVLAGALGVVWWPRETAPVLGSFWEGSVVASDDAPVDMTLPEGTHIRVDPRSEVKLLHSASDAVQMHLGHGSAQFDVTKKPSRRFSVNVGTVEVVVTGTKFRVLRKPTAGGERIQVEVIEGSVEVRRDEGGSVALHRGERWSTVIAKDGVAALAAPQVALVASAGTQQPTAASHEDATVVQDDESGDGEFALDEGEAGGERGELSSEGDEEEAEESEARRNEGRKRAAKAATAGKELFDRANLARRAGRLREAAELYGKLVARHPSDRRAPLAAFELGRLRMDSLHDLRGAIHALERALELAPSGTFAEDALARLVLAQEALHDTASCGRARTRYLARYPTGVHAQHVTERCGGI